MKSVYDSATCGCCDSSCNKKSVSNAKSSIVDGSGCLFASLG